MEGSEVRPLIELTLPAQPIAASEARRSLSVLASQVPEEDLRRCPHPGDRASHQQRAALRSRPTGRSDVWLGVWSNPDCLRVEVADSGKGFEKVVKPTTPDQLGGWGLQIVDRLTDRWGVKRVNGSAVHGLVRDRHSKA